MLSGTSNPLRTLRCDCRYRNAPPRGPLRTRVHGLTTCAPIEPSMPGSSAYKYRRPVTGSGDNVNEPAPASSAEDVLAIEPVIRRVVAARVANPSDVDDLVQDSLERLLGAPPRVAPETALPYGSVTARNVVTSHMRTATRRATMIPLIVDRL